MRCLILLFLALFLPGFCSAQEEDDYVNDMVLKYDDYIYQPNIKTVQFQQAGTESTSPIIPLYSNQQLELTFDDLDGDQKQYAITFVHCNADWTPSDLMISEYITGFYDLNIINFSFAANTLQKYTHYQVIFPSPGAQGNVQFTKSGNYLAYVYSNGDKSKLILSRRFMVYDERVSMAATFRQAIGNDQQYSHQQLDFNITATGGYNLTNPYRDMKVVLMQNNRWQNAITDIKPTFLSGNQLIYSLDEASTFNGGNEFRFFDIRSTRFLTERVKEIYRDDKMKFHAVLHTDQVRAGKPYLFYNDINGDFIIRNRDAVIDMDTEADYVEVEFFLSYPVPESKGNMYVLGRLTDWRMNRAGKMTYNYDRKGYELKLNLKQGYYNYIYVLSNDEKKGGNETIVEGNFWDTENDYSILVYHRKFGTYYDQLIGFRRLNSFNR